MTEEERNNQEITEGYAASQAAEILSRNSGQKISPDYVRKLAQKGKLRTVPINPRLTLYNKADVNGYKVEARGTKAARAAKLRAAKKKTTGRASPKKPETSVA